MTTEIVKHIEKNETLEILGTAYFDSVLKVLGWEKKEFILKFNTYLFTSKVDSENLKALFDMLIELTSLTFSLYKWSVLLVNLKASIFSNMILSIDLDGKFHYISEENSKLVLLNVDDDNKVYEIESFAKSQIVAILLYLYSQENVKLDMIELDKYYDKFTGSYLSFNQELAQEKKDYINFIDSEFKKYQERLTALQKIFFDNFTK